MYEDSASTSAPWLGLSQAVGASSPLSYNDYGLNMSLILPGSPDSVAPGPELYDGVVDGWMMTGAEGLFFVPPGASESIGSATAGLSVAVWFLISRTRSAINEGHNMLLAVTTTGGKSLRLTFTSGMKLKPRVSVSVAELPTPGAAQSTTSSDYASSDQDFDGGSVNSGGKASWQVNLVGLSCLARGAGYPVACRPPATCRTSTKRVRLRGAWAPARVVASHSTKSKALFVADTHALSFFVCVAPACLRARAACRWPAR
jgi:hypothetical protein